VGHPIQAEAIGAGLAAWGARAAWSFLSGTRLAFHAFTKNLGISVLKESEQFEKSMSKALINGISTIGVKVTGEIFSKFLLPVMAQVNKLGPLGTRFVSTTLGIVTALEGLGGSLNVFFGALGKLAGPLGILLGVLTPGYLKDDRGGDGGLGGEGDPLYKKRMAADALRRAHFARLHHHPTHRVVSAPPAPQKTSSTGTVINMAFNYQAAAGDDDATARRRALNASRDVASQVSGVLGTAARTLSRAAGSGASSATMSAYETAAGTA
jgi:hypothetical protein